VAGDWIKMRPSLLTSPKVNGIARILEGDQAVSRALSTGFNGHMKEIVTRDVMRYVTVAALLKVWGAANEHTRDGVFRNADLSDIDDIAGIPGFGVAMESVGWAVYDHEEGTVTLPNFSEYNTCGKNRSAERQRRYRERKKHGSDVTRDVTDGVTRDVTSDDREEKRRDKNISCSSGDERFADFWSIYPRKIGKDKALAAWKRKKLDAIADQIIEHVQIRIRRDRQWLEDQKYIPHPTTFLNRGGWKDEYEVAERPKIQGI